ncbi:hypothetical protein F66182_1210 [Fusarium sp. NRRL 66182]|nr:hypothetical protein F66182_1210 [Fusarium sp. NRRL 66182]
MISENNESNGVPITKTLDSSPNNSQVLDTACFLKLEEDLEANVVGSIIDEFAFIRFIPETPPPDRSAARQSNKINDEDYYSRRWQLLRARQVKRRRMESIRSVEGSEDTPDQRLPETPCTREKEALHRRPSQRTPPQTPESPVVSKLRPVPPGAPRLIEKKGRYTIRKGVRIRDYRLPDPNPWLCAPPSSSPVYQCRDGFDGNEASLGYPQPMILRSKQNVVHEQIAPGQERHRVLRSPSLGTPTHAQKHTEDDQS